MKPAETSDYELRKLAEQGLGPTEIVKYFGVAKSSVHERPEQLRLDINNTTTMHHGQIEYG